MRGLIVLLAAVALCSADLYMHNPRGSNDRLNEANGDRDNANRLYDSQDNAAGGYCYGPAMSYYEGSQLTIEWTNQHGCSNPKMQCNLVFQYMCGPTTGGDPAEYIRDGTTTNTIPDDPNAFNTIDPATGLYEFGMHESYAYYQQCATRYRNYGLFVADRVSLGDLNGQTAIFTRQNNNGDRYGFECQEERDYYPYWHPSPWKDIAVLTSDVSLCDLFQKQSQNVANKGQCQDPNNPTNWQQWNNQADCETHGMQWVETGAWGIDAPDCVVAPFTRDNHLGNGVNAVNAMYNWTLPTSDRESCVSSDNCNCVLRMRYNISTGDIDGWGFDDYTNSGEASPVQNNDIVSYQGNQFELAMDTTQFGRTFQDRSYVFHIKPRPSGVSELAKIFNLNVRGKRGNIVQVYPSTEYDFVPDYLIVHNGDYIHWQWTGCDTNPQGNAGEGTAGTDRSNIVQIANFEVNYPVADSWFGDNTPLFEDAAQRVLMSNLGQQNCLNYTQLLAKNGGNADNVEQDPQNCMKLNAAPTPYFDGGLIQMNKTGTFYYMNTRNNNFSNRSHKSVLVVAPLLPAWAVALLCIGGVAFLGSAGTAGAMFYAKSHPASKVAQWLGKIQSRI